MIQDSHNHPEQTNQQLWSYRLRFNVMLQSYCNKAVQTGMKIDPWITGIQLETHTTTAT